MAIVTFNAGSAIVTDGEQAVASGPIRPSVSADPSVRGRLLLRLQILVNLWIASGCRGTCPTENDSDLVADRPLQ